MASMREWLKGPESEPGRIVVVHCKAGKGRSGTVACSYLISQENWTVEDALSRFTARRMRSGFGAGVSIPSQQRWIRYVDYWTKHGKVYIDRPIEILEIHIWGLREGVKVAVEGFEEKGRIIKTFHTFSSSERTFMDVEQTESQQSSTLPNAEVVKPPEDSEANPLTTSASASSKQSESGGGKAALFRPSKPLIVPNSDINIDIEKRNKATYGFTMVTSVAHVWFNTYFESQFSLQSSEPNASQSPSTTSSVERTAQPLQLHSSGVFNIEWDAMDGLRGSAKKGTKALDRLSVVWRAVDNDNTGLTKIITQPQTGESVPDTGPANWKEAKGSEPPNKGKVLGLRVTTDHSATVSKASSFSSVTGTSPKGDTGSDIDEGVKPHGPDGEEFVSHHSSSAPQAEATSFETTPLVSVTGPQSPTVGVQDHAAAAKKESDPEHGKVDKVSEGIKAIDFDKT